MWIHKDLCLRNLGWRRGKSQITVCFWDISVAEPRDLGDRVRMFFHVAWDPCGAVTYSAAAR